MSTQKIRISILFLCLIVSFTYLSAKQVKITILHTNDTHSQVEPIGENESKNPDMGGYARRMGLIEQIRSEEKNVLLLDAGDYWQGTPYFNFYNGRVEIDAMNRMKYDAATFGNHEFDNGIDTMAVVLKGAKFPIVSSNYIFENDDFLRGFVKPYIIIERGGVRIGIMGLNVNPEGLILQNSYKGMTYLNPIDVAIETSRFLKKDKKCDLVICLSHLGVEEGPNLVTDFEIAQNTQYIDVIIGGHSHQIIENTTEKNKDGKNVIIAQMGKSGAYLGRIDLILEN